MNPNSNPQIATGRVIGFDSHPDSFTAAILCGQSPASAIIQKLFNKVPMGQLRSWANKHLAPDDLVVLEASGNSFEVVRSLAAAGFKAKVLESCHMGKLKEHHANNDKISAVRIGKAYLAGTAKEVWVPDLKTQQRRDLFHLHRKSVKRTTQLRNRLLSYLSDNGVRLPQGLPLARGTSGVKEAIGQAHDWSSWQWQMIEGILEDLEHANQQRARWRSLIAQEVVADPLLLSMVRLCGVRDLIAFALGAIIGDINRFPNAAKLVKYMGLTPAFDDSGDNEWRGGITHQGRKDLRCLLIESAQAVLQSNHPLAQWGKKLLARKGAIKLVVTAIARKLTVAIWYLMMGKWTPFEEVDSRLKIKVTKIISQVGAKALKMLKKSRKELREEIYTSLARGRVYRLDPQKTFIGQDQSRPSALEPTDLRREYGLA